MDKEEFHWVFGVMRGWFSAKLGSKSVIICKSNVTPFVVQNLVKVDPVPKKRAF
jgi:hypothetical protein